MFSKVIRYGDFSTDWVFPTNMIDMYCEKICQLYFIKEKDTGIIKIGTSEEVERRKNTLQTGNSSDLELIECFNIMPYKYTINKKPAQEAIIHSFLDDLKKRGELFRDHLILRLLIKALREVQRDYRALITCDDIIKAFAWVSACMSLENGLDEEAYLFLKIYEIEQSPPVENMLNGIRFYTGSQKSLFPNPYHPYKYYFGWRLVDQKKLNAIFYRWENELVKYSLEEQKIRNEFVASAWYGQISNKKKDIQHIDMQKMVSRLIAMIAHKRDTKKFLVTVDPNTLEELSDDEVKERCLKFQKLPAIEQEQLRNNLKRIPLRLLH